MRGVCESGVLFMATRNQLGVNFMDNNPYTSILSHAYAISVYRNNRLLLWWEWHSLGLFRRLSDDFRTVNRKKGRRSRDAQHFPFLLSQSAYIVQAIDVLYIYMPETQSAVKFALNESIRDCWPNLAGSSKWRYMAKGLVGTSGTTHIDCVSSLRIANPLQVNKQTRSSKKLRWRSCLSFLSIYM